MPFTDVVSGAPVPAVCQALQPLRNGAKQGKQIKLAGPKADKECDLWQDEKDLSAPGRLELSPKKRPPALPR
ncbi:Hypothetical protein SMAX5B_010898 [Scophthalmus maximus]|uniref:Uncharacterized protein n=1 Tax=Scophthalmus maximus TaxID=52904 RepID=A0A2U9BRU4_SCOMX|nr:Hypothetical protein SMAX5B_010898 [Scophthalmus maximus]